MWHNDRLMSHSGKETFIREYKKSSIKTCITGGLKIARPLYLKTSFRDGNVSLFGLPGRHSGTWRMPRFRGPTGFTAPALSGAGDLYSMLATGKDTNNAFFQFEAIVPEGGGPPPHIHSREDESFYIVSGKLEILLGDKTFQAKRGDFVYIPRGTIHQFKNVGSDSAVQLVTFVPAGIECFFQEVFPEVKDRNAAPLPVTEELIKKMNEAAPKYGLQFVSPPDGGKR